MIVERMFPAKMKELREAILEMSATAPESKDAISRREARIELAIDILKKITWKNKPSTDDIPEIKRAIAALEGIV